MPDSRPRRPLTAVGAVTTAAGLLLFAWWIRRTGFGEIRAGFEQIGWWGLAAVVLLGGLRFAVRAAAWTLCIDSPFRLPFRHALRAVVAGDALGNLLPLGPLISEPTKAAFVRGKVPVASAVAALAIENVTYTLSVAAVIAAGMAALLFTFELPDVLRQLSVAAIGTVVALFTGAVIITRTRPAVLSVLVARIPLRLRGLLKLQPLEALEDQIYTFATRRPATLAAVAGLELLFHGLGVLEAYITLWLLLGAPQPLIVAFVVETVNRMITVVFKFIPMGWGVNEAGTALLTGMLDLGAGAPTGTTIGLVRKVRLLCWAAVGTGLLIQRGLSAGRILADAQLEQEGQ